MDGRWKWAVVMAVSLSLGEVSAQGPDLHRVMRKKLEHSQKILEAVVTSNWVALETHSRELEELTNDPGWKVLNSPEYARQSLAFKQAVRELHDAAARRELDATPLAYVAVTLSCVQCHRSLARARIAK